MAGEYNKSHEYETKAEEGCPVETQDRGMFDFLGKKKEEKPVHHEQEEVMVSEFEKVKVSEPEPAYVDCSSKPAEHGYHHEEPKEEHKEEKKHETLSEKLRRSDSSSSSSSDEEGDDEEKKKKRKEKKGLKEKISGDKEEEEKKKHGYEQDTEVPVEKFHEEQEHPYDHGPHHHEEPKVEPTVAYTEEQKKEDEKKGFLEKIKDKLPGHKKPEDVPVASPPPPEYENVEPAYHEGEVKEKKGLLEKIKEKIPGYHPKTEEEKLEKEKEKPTGSY